MTKRPRPNLDQVREAMRDHDDRHQDEEPTPPEDTAAGENEDEDEDDDDPAVGPRRPVGARRS
jgi:hypothetical protein